MKIMETDLIPPLVDFRSLPLSSSKQCIGPEGSKTERIQVAHRVLFEQNLLEHRNSSKKKAP